MKRASIVIILAILVFFHSCDSEDTHNNNPINEKADSIKTDKKKTNEDENQKNLTSLVNELGGYKNLRVTESLEKCNLFKGDFILNKIITDSTTLAQLANHLAFYIYDNYNTKQNCSYATMSIVHIYMNQKDFLNKEDVVFSEIIPAYPKGIADVTSRVLAKYKLKK